MNDRKRESRREFLGLSAAVAGTALVSAHAVAGRGASRQWSRQADVVVVGSGAAGLSAAIAAAHAGASVLILEKGPVAGGTTAKSDGAYWVPNNHLLRARGGVDPKQDAMKYMIRCSYPALYREDQPSYGIGASEFALIDTFYERASGAIEGLEAAGALKSMIIDLPDYADHAPQNKLTHGRILVPMRPDGQIGQGRELVRQLRAKVDAQKIPLLTNHAVTAIERNARGEVVGLAVTGADGPAWVRAIKGVIFASGGFTHNPSLMLNFQPAPNWGGCAVPTNQGDFVRIGIETGAMLGNMVNAWRAEVVLESALESASVSRDVWQPPGDSMILVNKYGSRVTDEKRNYHERTRLHFIWDPVESEFPNLFLFMIYDQRTAELFAGDFPLPGPGDEQPYVIRAPDLTTMGTVLQSRLDTLAPRIGRTTLAPDFAAKLATQIDTYNAGASQGVDTQFQRGKYPYDTQWHSIINSKERSDTKWPPNTGPNPTLHPIDKNGPLYVIILAAGTLDTNGGPVINSNAQVLDTRGRPIAGLFGAGNCIASPAAQGYWGAGGTLGPAMTFGTIAGSAAAAESAKEDG